MKEYWEGTAAILSMSYEVNGMPTHCGDLCQLLSDVESELVEIDVTWVVTEWLFDPSPNFEQAEEDNGRNSRSRDRDPPDVRVYLERKEEEVCPNGETDVKRVRRWIGGGGELVKVGDGALQSRDGLHQWAEDRRVERAAVGEVGQEGGEVHPDSPSAKKHACVGPNVQYFLRYLHFHASVPPSLWHRGVFILSDPNLPSVPIIESPENASGRKRRPSRKRTRKSWRHELHRRQSDAVMPSTQPRTISISTPMEIHDEGVIARRKRCRPGYGRLEEAFI